MAYRVLEVTLLSAKDLKSVNLITRMEVYAVATISGDPITRQCTTPDPHGGRHPTWNATLRFTVPPTAEAATGCLHVLLRAERSLGDRDVGEVIVPLADIFAGAGSGDLGPRPPQFAYFQVRKVHRTETRGTLYLSYSLGPVVAPQVPPQARAGEPVLAYPAQVQLLPSPPPPPPPQATGHMAVPAPLPEKTAGHVAVPSPPKPAVHVAVPPSPKPSGYVTVPSPAKPAVHVAMPPSQKPSGGNVAAPSPAKPAGHVTVLPSPKPVMHVAVPPSPKPAGHAAVSPPPKPSGQVAASPRTVNNNSNLEFGIGLGAGLVGGAISGMLAGGKRGEAITFLPEATFARSRKEAGSKTYGRDVVTSYVQ